MLLVIVFTQWKPAGSSPQGEDGGCLPAWIPSRSYRQHRNHPPGAGIGLSGARPLPSGGIGIETVNMLGRYPLFCLLALSLDLIWGRGMLCLCQSFFFSLGGFAMGMFLATTGVPRASSTPGVETARLPVRGLPLRSGTGSEEALVPEFWNRSGAAGHVAVGMLIPGAGRRVIGFFVFRSRVRGVFFAILTRPSPWPPGSCSR
ncbi:MAG: hypothetical protein Ct9H300mP1_01300 [Planctomycetaceae bacterium]|nr:MAG: hypothetical protein Ct9H300mP1_01300 [Planctomycetaceae bacterium]